MASGSVGEDARAWGWCTLNVLSREGGITTSCTAGGAGGGIECSSCKCCCGLDVIDVGDMGEVAVCGSCGCCWGLDGGKGMLVSREIKRTESSATPSPSMISPSRTSANRSLSSSLSRSSRLATAPCPRLLAVRVGLLDSAADVLRSVSSTRKPRRAGANVTFLGRFLNGFRQKDEPEENEVEKGTRVGEPESLRALPNGRTCWPFA